VARSVDVVTGFYRRPRSSDWSSVWHWRRATQWRAQSTEPPYDSAPKCLPLFHEVTGQAFLCITRHQKQGLQRVQVLADISRSALWCLSNETRAPTANPTSSAQLGATPCHSPKLHPGPSSSVRMWWRHADREIDTQTAIHFASSATHAKVYFATAAFTARRYASAVHATAPCLSDTSRCSVKEAKLIIMQTMPHDSLRTDAKDILDFLTAVRQGFHLT